MDPGCFWIRTQVSLNVDPAEVDFIPPARDLGFGLCISYMTHLTFFDRHPAEGRVHAGESTAGRGRILQS